MLVRIPLWLRQSQLAGVTNGIVAAPAAGCPVAAERLAKVHTEAVEAFAAEIGLNKMWRTKPEHKAP